MVLDWLNQPIGGSPSLADLIARKKYGRAIEVLKEQFAGRSPGAQVRLQLADLLVLAGRTEEAVPILVGLSDEFAVERFVAKAIAILKRVDRIDPGRPDVQERLAMLARQQRAATESIPLKPIPPPPTRKITFDIEEIEQTGSPRPRPREKDPPPPPPVVTVPVPPSASDEPVASVDPDTIVVEVESFESATLEPLADGSVNLENEPGVVGSVGGRIRGALRRLFAARPEPAVAPEQQSPPVDAPASVPVEEPATAASAPASDAPASETEAVARPAGAPSLEAIGPADLALPESAADGPAVASPIEAPMAEAAAPVPDEPHPESDVPSSVSVRMRSVLKRILASLPGVELAEAATQPATPDTPPAGTSGDAEPAVPLGVDASPVPALEEPVTEALAQATPEPPPPATPVADPAPAPPPLAEPVSVPPAPEIVEAAEVVEEADQGTASETTPVAEAESEVAPPPADDGPLMTQEIFQVEILDFVEELLRRPVEPQEPPPSADWRAYREALLATPLFAGFAEPELLAVIEGLRLLTYEDGDVVVTEDEPGESLFVVAAGQVKVFVRNPDGRNFQVSTLHEGDFFGEISSMSGRPRSATVVAASRLELLELDRATLDRVARAHPRTREILETQYVERAGSAESAAVRAVPLGAPGLAASWTQRKAMEALEANFGESRWDPRMRLRLADVLVKAGKYDDALPILIGLADDLARAGLPEKAVAVLKKIEKIQSRHVEALSLAPLRLEDDAATPETSKAPGRASAAKPRTAGFFDRWLVDVVREAVKPPVAEVARDADPRTLQAYGPGLRASPLFEGLDEEELLALVRGLRLLVFQSGDVIVTEGEAGQSVFLLASGAVKVCVRSPSGRNVPLCTLAEGAFFGEISALSGRPRSATVTAAGRCELLELDRATLEAIEATHPRVQRVLEEYSIARASSPHAVSIRTLAFGPRPETDLSS